MNASKSGTVQTVRSFFFLQKNIAKGGIFWQIYMLQANISRLQEKPRSNSLRHRLIFAERFSAPHPPLNSRGRPCTAFSSPPCAARKAGGARNPRPGRRRRANSCSESFGKEGRPPPHFDSPTRPPVPLRRPPPGSFPGAAKSLPLSWEP